MAPETHLCVFESASQYQLGGRCLSLCQMLLIAASCSFLGLYQRNLYALENSELSLKILLRLCSGLIFYKPVFIWSFMCTLEQQLET